MTIIHIDGDGIVYRAGHSADSRNGIKSHSLNNAKMIIQKILKVTGADEYKIYLTNKDPSVNFRTTIYPEYKKNRVRCCRGCRGSNLSKEGIITTEPTKNGLCRRRLFKCLDCPESAQDLKPVYYQAIRNYLIERWKAEVVQWGEADDWFHGADWVATHDKDIYQLDSTNIYNIMSENITENIDLFGELDLLEIPIHDKYGDPVFLKNGNLKTRKDLKGSGFIWFCAQLLLGDDIDNIPAPRKGFGPVKIYEYLKGLTSCHQAITAIIAFYVEHSSIDQLKISCQLLWISRHPKQIGTLDTIIDHALKADEEIQNEINSKECQEPDESAT